MVKRDRKRNTGERRRLTKINDSLRLRGPCPQPDKRCYRTVKEARKVAKMSRGALHAYHCECGLYHLTSKARH